MTPIANPIQPMQGVVIVYQNRRDGFIYYLRPDGTSVLLNILGDVFKIHEGFNFKLGNALKDYDIIPINTEDNIPTFQLVRKPIVVSRSGGGGVRRITNPITVQNEGVAITSGVTVFNFTGAGVTASAVGNNVTVNIPASIPPDCLIEVTYAELVALIGTDALEEGCFYLITDFQTVHTIPNTAIVHEGTIEPIIVQANTPDSIHAEAISTVFDGAEILYEVVDSTTSGGTKGRIYYRWDTVEDNQTWYDWRSVIFRRWNDGSGNFTSLTDNGNGFQDYYTFNEIYIAQAFASAPMCFGNEIGAITDFGIFVFGAPSSKLNNMVFNDITYDNDFKNDCFDSTLGLGAGVIAHNIVAPFFFNNTVGDDCIDNELHIIFNDNSVGNNFGENVILGNCSNNDIGNNFANNIVGNKLQMNTIGDDFIENFLGGNFFNNVIGVGFEFNHVRQSCLENFIGDAFQSNTIGDNFNTNGTALIPIGNSFIGNFIGNTFHNNIIGDSFQDNHILNDFAFNDAGADFKANFINDHATSNTIGIFFQSNNIGDFFHDNVIMDNFFQNLIGNDFALNNVDSGFQNNQIGNLFSGKGFVVILGYSTLAGGSFAVGDILTGSISGNTGTVIQNSDNGGTTGSVIVSTLGTYSDADVISNGLGVSADVDIIVYGNLIRGQFIGNVIVNNFQTNSINYVTTGLVGFNENDIFNDFQTNIVGMDGEVFRKNYIESDLVAPASVNGFDFTASTHVYANYTFEIKLTDDGATYLGYYYVTTVPPAVTILSAVPNA